MRKWMFVVGVIICAVLFFLSGTLTGYLYCEKSFAKTTTETIKNPRQPSSKPKNALIGRIIRKQTMDLKKKIRIPTNPALRKYQEYRDKLTG